MTTAATNKDLFTTSQAAAHLKISQSWVLKLVRSGRLKSAVADERRGKTFLIERRELERYREWWEQDRKEREQQRRERWRKWKKTA